MAARTRDEVRRELETERARLGDAVRTLRAQSGHAARKLSLAALGAAAVGAATRIVRRRSKAKTERARLPFLGRD
ncbi:MAG TPA: hypothetical protein VFB35_08575 [Gaiellaceae bacterium]|nr:hypothetical protein [Gaiellaceae bacterium]